MVHGGEQWEYNGGLEQGIHRYTTQEYDGIEEFFAPYVDDILSTVRYLREDHGDGRLFKIFEDTVLALVVKNYMEYDYVVGNPPYVRIQHLPDHQKVMIEQLYESATGNYDLYCPFYERGLEFLKAGGKLGYITPNQFMVTDYGEGIRQVLRRDSLLVEVYDFRDSGVFADATNYPAIVIAEDEPDGGARNNNQIRCVRVKGNVDDETGRAVDEEIIASVRAHRDEAGYSDEFIDVFDFPQGELGGGYWSLMPPEELEVFRKLEDTADDRIESVTDAVFQGIRTSANKIYIVEVLDADRVKSDDAGDIVTVVPTGESEQYEIETDLLRPFLKGNDVGRWRGNWSGLHVLYPYHVEVDEEGDSVARLYDENGLRDDLPLSWEFFAQHEAGLRAREQGAWEDSETWWEFGRTQNLEKFETPKTIQAEISDEATFMLDEEGTWYFTTAYGVTFDETHRDITDILSIELNSKALDFYLKHVATIKAGGYYSYRTQYVEKLPCITTEQNDEFDMLRKKAGEIADSIDSENRTDRFPEAYLGDYDGDLGYIDYEWQTRRYPVNAEIQQKADGRFAVTAGRSDEITDPLMDRGDREERTLRAEYVHAAVDGRSMKKGEEQTIAIPQSRAGVEQLIEAWEADKRMVEATSIEELEAEIDRVVYDLFGLTESERAVIEEYLEVF